MFVEIGGGWHVNLAHVAKIHVVDQGGVGTVVKFYSPANELLADFSPPGPDDLMRVLNLIHAIGKMPPAASSE